MNWRKEAYEEKLDKQGFTFDEIEKMSDEKFPDEDNKESEKSNSTSDNDKKK